MYEYSPLQLSTVPESEEFEFFVKVFFRSVVTNINFFEVIRLHISRSVSSDGCKVVNEMWVSSICVHSASEHLQLNSIVHAHRAEENITESLFQLAYL